MGMTEVKLTIKNPRYPERAVTAKFLVDSGAHYTVLPQEIVKKLGLKPSYSQEFNLADGKTIKRSIGGATVVFEGKELPVAVVLGQKDDAAILGVTTLESFGLMIDPFKRKLYHSKLMLASLILSNSLRSL
jgi:clan AA aspartic protease